MTESSGLGVAGDFSNIFWTIDTTEGPMRTARVLVFMRAIFLAAILGGCGCLVWGFVFSLVWGGFGGRDDVVKWFGGGVVRGTARLYMSLTWHHSTNSCRTVMINHILKPGT